MGGVQDTYLRYEAAGDQYVGRVVCGLPISSSQFAALPPQFDCCIHTADEIVKLFFLGLPNTLYCAGKYFAASILYSFDKLKQHLNPSNPLLSALFCTSSKFKSYKECTYQKYARSYLGDGDLVDNTSQEPSASIPERVKPITRATGIPSHVLLLADMQRVINSQQDVLKKIENVIKDEFDQREVGHSSLIIQQEMKDIIKKFESRVINEINDLKFVSHHPTQGLSSSTDIGTMMLQMPSGSNGGRWYHWEGKFRRVPSDWVFPPMTLRGALYRYFLPDENNKVCAFKHFHASDVANIKNDKRILSSLHRLIKFIINMLKAKNKVYPNPSTEDVDEMYKLGSGPVLALSKSNRSESFSWRTHYKNVEEATRKNKN